MIWAMILEKLPTSNKLTLANSPDEEQSCEMKKNAPEKVCVVNTPTSFEQERELLHRTVLSSVSHDLKTPLSCIIGSLEIFGRANSRLSSANKKNLIDTALKEAYRLDGFITNILDMAKLESGAVVPIKKPYDMAFLIDDCLIMMGPRLQECHVLVKPPVAPIRIKTDHLLLSRALCILLDNAAKYCSGNIDIRIESEQTAKRVFIHVEDNGPGIPKSKMTTIFSKYTRLSRKDSQQASTGLGLAICREIMQLLGGSVTIKNRSGGGAIFTLTFPA